MVGGTLPLPTPPKTPPPLGVGETVNNGERVASPEDVGEGVKVGGPGVPVPVGVEGVEAEAPPTTGDAVGAEEADRVLR